MMRLLLTMKELVEQLLKCCATDLNVQIMIRDKRDPMRKFRKLFVGPIIRRHGLEKLVIDGRVDGLKA